MLKLLADAGHAFTDLEAEADVAIVNTCSFIGDAKEESISEIFRLAAYKKTGRLKALIATGCLAERYQDEIMEAIPELDACLGINDWDRIAELVEKVNAGEKAAFFSKPYRNPVGTGRSGRTIRHTAYLKIAEGCDKHCTYCIIPKIRGPYRSIPMEELIREAEELSEDGARELILVAQETTLYGTDLYGRKMLPALLEKLSELPMIHWIRILYCYPEEITDELVDAVSRLEKVVPYLDLPVQHGADTVLKRMNRKTTRKEILKTIRTLRKRIPGIALRTTLITGFPGETEEEFEALKSFVEEARFDRLGVFPYSREEGTPAYSMKPAVPKRLREKRRREIMKLQQGIAFEIAKNRIGETVEAIVEGMVSGEEGVYVCRTAEDAPDVDGYLFVKSEGPLLSGDFITARVTGAKGYDLTGELIG